MSADRPLRLQAPPHARSVQRDPYVHRNCPYDNKEFFQCILPARLLDSRQISLQRIQPERILSALATSLAPPEYHFTHPRHTKMLPKHSLSFSSFYTPVVDLRSPGVRVHLCELKLGLSADSLGEKGVGDHIAESLSEGT